MDTTTAHDTPASGISPARDGYSGLQIGLHWIIAALVVLQVLNNGGMQEAWNAYEDGEAAPEGVVGWAWSHALTGATILMLALVRVYVRLTRGAPPVHRDKPELLVWIAYATHFVLYGFIILMPLTGALAWFFGVDASAEVHETGKLLLIPLVALHAIGGLTEHFYFRNDTLRRMLRPER